MTFGEVPRQPGISSTRRLSFPLETRLAGVDDSYELSTAGDDDGDDSPADALFAVAEEDLDFLMDAAADDADGVADGADGVAERRDVDEPTWRAGLATAGPWGALAERWVPEPLRGARVSPGRRGAVLLAAIAAAAAVVAAVGVWFARPAPVPVTDEAESAWVTVGARDDAAGTASGAEGDAEAGGRPALPGPIGGQQSAASAGASDAARQEVASDSARQEVADDRADGGASLEGEDGPILVSVTGQVRHPGVVTVPGGARVADAIAAAGGVDDTDLLVGMNLAARVYDGSSIVVAGPSGNAVVRDDSQVSGVASQGTTGTDVVIDINVADAAALEELPGVGPVTAESIIAYRNDHGPFTDVAQLQDVSGIGPATFARLVDRVRI